MSANPKAGRPTPEGGDLLLRLPRIIIISAVAYLVLAWLAFLFIDAKNVFGLRDQLVASGMANPSIWYHLFRWNGFTEMIQWLSLATAVVVAAYGAGHLRARGLRGASLFWNLISITMMLILIEDAGDPRHTLATYAQGVFKDAPSLVVSGIVEGIYFLILGSIPLYALLRYGRYGFFQRRIRPYIFLGFGLYGTVAAFSGTRNIWDWFGQTGGRLHSIVTDGKLDLVKPLGWDLYLTNFYLMDNLVVESIEVLAACGFAAASLTFLYYAQNHPELWEKIADPRILAGLKRKGR